MLFFHVSSITLIRAAVAVQGPLVLHKFIRPFYWHKMTFTYQKSIKAYKKGEENFAKCSQFVLAATKYVTSD